MTVSTNSAASKTIQLRPDERTPEVLELESKLRAKIVGQEAAVSRFLSVYQTFLAGMTDPGRPVATLLFLGPTGSGKTRLVEAAAEILFGSPNAFIKVDCAEFQHSHEIAKLIGSPPGYLGHRETAPVLTQEAVNRFHTDRLQLSFLLFDEIEKASDALWQLLLGILDKASVTLGDNRRVDFSRTIVFMTSNLGASEMSRLLTGGIGFAPARTDEATVEEREQKIHRVAIDAARRRFSPEFMNRIDKVVVFRTLTAEQLRRVLDIELAQVQNRIIKSHPQRMFVLQCTLKARDFLLKEGTDPRYGARPLKRAIERHLVFALSNLISTGQLEMGDILTVDLNEQDNQLTFTKLPSGGAPRPEPGSDLTPSRR